MESTTMKKTYINPEMEIVKIQTMQMLAASDKVFLGDPVSDASDAEGHYDEYDW